MTAEIPEPAMPASSGATLDDVLAALRDASAALKAAAPAPAAAAAPAGVQGYAGRPGAGSLGGPLAAPVPPPPPAADAAPHPGETFAPGDVAYYEWQDPRNPAAPPSVQVIAVTHADDQHVHGVVLGDARQLATFAQGVLTHTHPAAG